MNEAPRSRLERLCWACAVACVGLSWMLPVTLGGAWLYGRSSATATTLPVTQELASVTGTLTIAALATFVAAPLALLSAIYLVEATSARWHRPLGRANEALASIPSLAYGVFGVLVLAPSLHPWIEPLGARQWVSAGLCLGLMSTPRLSLRMQAALRRVPRDLRHAAAALGGSELRTLRYVVLPSVLVPLAAASVAGWTRALGDTTVVAVVGGLATPRPLQVGLANAGQRFPRWDSTESQTTIELGALLLGLALASFALETWLERRSNR